MIDTAAFPARSIAGALQPRRAVGVEAPVLRGMAAPLTGASLQAGPVEALQTLAAPGWTPVLTDSAGEVVLARAPDRPLYVLSDPDLMNTQGLRDVRTLGTALAVLNALRGDDGPFLFDVRLHGLGRGRSVLRLLFDPPFLAVTLCLGVAALLAGVQAFVRFGPARRPGRAIALGKAALVDNTAALIQLAGRERRMGGRYADLTAELAARSVGAPRGLAGGALTAFLDRLGARRGLPRAFSDLAMDARSTPTAEQMTEAARRLFVWRLALVGAAAAVPTPAPSPSTLTGAAEAGSVVSALQPDGHAP